MKTREINLKVLRTQKYETVVNAFSFDYFVPESNIPEELGYQEIDAIAREFRVMVGDKHFVADQAFKERLSGTEDEFLSWSTWDFHPRMEDAWEKLVENLVTVKLSVTIETTKEGYLKEIPGFVKSDKVWNNGKGNDILDSYSRTYISKI